jgi:hypothetical protein
LREPKVKKVRHRKAKPATAEEPVEAEEAGEEVSSEPGRASAASPATLAATEESEGVDG